MHVTKKKRLQNSEVYRETDQIKKESRFESSHSEGSPSEGTQGTDYGYGRGYEGLVNTSNEGRSTVRRTIKFKEVCRRQSFTNDLLIYLCTYIFS